MHELGLSSNQVPVIIIQPTSPNEPALISPPFPSKDLFHPRSNLTSQVTPPTQPMESLQTQEDGSTGGGPHSLVWFQGLSLVSSFVFYLQLGVGHTNVTRSTASTPQSCLLGFIPQGIWDQGRPTWLFPRCGFRFGPLVFWVSTLLAIYTSCDSMAYAKPILNQYHDSEIYILPLQQGLLYVVSQTIFMGKIAPIFKYFQESIEIIK